MRVGIVTIARRMNECVFGCLLIETRLREGSLDLSETVHHESNELDAAESGDFVLCLEAFEEEGEELGNESGRWSVLVLVVFVLFVVLFSLGLLLCGFFRVCSFTRLISHFPRKI